MTFAEFYHRHPTDLAVAAVDDLFQAAIGSWYEREREKRSQPLELLCREWLGTETDVLEQAELDGRVTHLCQTALAIGVTGLDCSAYRLIFRASNGIEFFYPNPVPYLCGQRITVDPPTLCGVTHGRLDGTSVLANRGGQTWVVDFGNAGLGPLVQDFVSLETSVKFDMLARFNMTERHELESRLLATCHLGEPVDAQDAGPGIQKPLRVIGQIRAHAANVVGQEMNPYLMGLLFCAARRLQAYHPGLRYTRGEVAVFVHTLLSMAMVCQRLVSWKDYLRDLPPQAADSLWIDVDNLEVWVEGRQVTLASQGFRLLKYLYDHANQLCKRSAIAKDVFGVDFSDLRPAEIKLMEKDQINTNISRLRKAIEPNPSYPKYILTVHGAGYKLVLGGVTWHDKL